MKTNSDCLHQRASSCAILNISLFGWKSCKSLLVASSIHLPTGFNQYEPLEMLPNHQRDKYLLVWRSTPCIPQLTECESPHSWYFSIIASTAVSFYLSWPWGKGYQEQESGDVSLLYLSVLQTKVLDRLSRNCVWREGNYNILHSYVLNFCVPSQKNISCPKVQLIFALGNSS